MIKITGHDLNGLLADRLTVAQTASEYSVKITLGSSKPKPIDKVNKTAAALAASLKQPAKTPYKLVNGDRTLEYSDSGQLNFFKEGEINGWV